MFTDILSQTSTLAMSTGEVIDDATVAVLTTTELLEAILIRLDMKTLLLQAQCVSHRWAATIAGSHSLQQKLFMRLATRAEAVKLGMIAPDEHLALGSKQRPIWDCSDENTFSDEDFTEDYSNQELIVVNPLLIARGSAGVHTPGVQLGQLCGLQNEIPTAGPREVGPTYWATDIKPGSWQRMYISMPPPPYLEVSVTLEDFLLNGSRHAFSAKGCHLSGNKTLGRVMEDVEKACTSYRWEARWAPTTVRVLGERERAQIWYSVVKVDG